MPETRKAQKISDNADVANQEPGLNEAEAAAEIPLGADRNGDAHGENDQGEDRPRRRRQIELDVSSTSEEDSDSAEDEELIDQIDFRRPRVDKIKSSPSVC